VIYSSDLFTYNAKYFHTSSGEKWPSFANSCLLNMGGEPNYYRGPHELCIITGGSKIQVILSKNSAFINYEEE